MKGKLPADAAKVMSLKYPRQLHPLLGGRRQCPEILKCAVSIDTREPIAPRHHPAKYHTTSRRLCFARRIAPAIQFRRAICHAHRISTTVRRCVVQLADRVRPDGNLQPK